MPCFARRALVFATLLTLPTALLAQTMKLSATDGGHQSATSVDKTAKYTVIREEKLPPTTIVNASGVKLLHFNRFRYNGSLQIQETVNPAATPIAGLVPPSSGSGAMLLTQQPPPNPGGVANNLVSLGTSPDPNDVKVDAFVQESSGYDDTLNERTVELPADLAHATAEKQCFQSLQTRYPAVLLTESDQKDLRAELSGVSSHNKCRFSPSGILDAASTTLAQAISLQQRLAQFKASKDGAAWISKSSNNATKFSAVQDQNTKDVTGLQQLVGNKDVTTTDTLEQYNALWLARATASANDASWSSELPLACTVQWFGKTSGQTVNVISVDMAADNPTPVTTKYFTNSCLASLTVTTGLGLSFVANQTYASEPQGNANPPAQVIGTSSDNRITPIFVAQMNYSYLGKHEGPVGMHASFGLGLSSTGAGTSTDIFFGNALSVAHRALFITPSAHLTQRQSLQGGYHIGDPMTNLSSVPTVTKWKLGFALTFTLPVVSP